LTWPAGWGILPTWRDSFACNIRGRFIMWIRRGGLAGMRFAQAAQGRPGEDRLGAAVAAGNDHAAQMDLRPIGDGFLEIRHAEAL